MPKLVSATDRPAQQIGGQLRAIAPPRQKTYSSGLGDVANTAFKIATAYKKAGDAAAGTAAYMVGVEQLQDEDNEVRALGLIDGVARLGDKYESILADAKSKLNTSAYATFSKPLSVKYLTMRAHLGKYTRAKQRANLVGSAEAAGLLTVRYAASPAVYGHEGAWDISINTTAEMYEVAANLGGMDRKDAIIAVDAMITAARKASVSAFLEAAVGDAKERKVSNLALMSMLEDGDFADAVGVVLLNNGGVVDADMISNIERLYQSMTTEERDEIRTKALKAFTDKSALEDDIEKRQEKIEKDDADKALIAAFAEEDDAQRDVMVKAIVENAKLTGALTSAQIKGILVFNVGGGITDDKVARSLRAGILRGTVFFDDILEASDKLDGKISATLMTLATTMREKRTTVGISMIKASFSIISGTVFAGPERLALDAQAAQSILNYRTEVKNNPNTNALDIAERIASEGTVKFNHATSESAKARVIRALEGIGVDTGNLSWENEKETRANFDKLIRATDARDKRIVANIVRRYLGEYFTMRTKKGNK